MSASAINLKHIDAQIALLKTAKKKLSQLLMLKTQVATLQSSAVKAHPAPAATRTIVDNVLNAASTVFGVDAALILSGSREAGLAVPRMMCYKIIKEKTRRSQKETASLMGRDNHATVHHGIRRIENLIDTDQDIADKYKQVLAITNGQ